MSIKLVGSVSAFALALAFGGAAMAQQVDGNSQSNVTQVSVPGLNGNSVGNGNTKTSKSNNTIDSGNTKTENRSEVEKSYNTDNSTNDSGNTKTENKSEIEKSYNTDNSTNDSGNTKTENDKSFNTDNSVSNRDSNNKKTEDSNNTRDSYNTKDSYNTDNSVNTKTVTVTKTYNISKQDLDAAVSNVSQGSDAWDKGDDAKEVTTGDISQSGNAFQGFGGISTASNNTGFGSNGQAATMVNANANVTFGH